MGNKAFSIFILLLFAILISSEISISDVYKKKLRIIKLSRFLNSATPGIFSLIIIEIPKILIDQLKL